MQSCDQTDSRCRCEWGIRGHDALAPADVVIVVDVLSFATCVDVAVSRGAVILPYPWKDGSAAEFATQHHAQLAGSRGRARYSLSPATYLDAPPGLRCVLPSPNGATLALRASTTGSRVLAGCLRNARAVAEAAATLGTTFNVCAAGEQWPDGSIRFAIEDWLGAGAILRHLPGPRSAEADVAVAAFDATGASIDDAIRASASGRELSARRFSRDVELAAEVNVSRHVPILNDGAFVALQAA